MICMVRQAQKLQYSCAWEAIKKIKKRLDNLMTGRTNPRGGVSGVFHRSHFAGHAALCPAYNL
jgi:hypothetical protein